LARGPTEAAHRKARSIGAAGLGDRRSYDAACRRSDRRDRVGATGGSRSIRSTRWRRVSAGARARDDLGRERHANQQYSYGLAEDDRDYLQVVQVQKRRDSEPGGENKVEVDV